MSGIEFKKKQLENKADDYTPCCHLVYSLQPPGNYSPNINATTRKKASVIGEVLIYD